MNGIKLALKVLNEYYAKADKAHDSGDGASTGIIGLLEVVASEFSKGLTEMNASEETPQNIAIEKRRFGRTLKPEELQKLLDECTPEADEERVADSASQYVVHHVLS